jgi:hypothetical protein
MQYFEDFPVRQAGGLHPALSRSRRCLFCFVLSACTALAQGTLSGPSLGLVYDPAAQAIRPVLGIPGASTAGKHIDLGFTIAAAAIAPSHNYALALSTDGSLQLVTFRSDGVSAQAISSSARPDRMVLSPSGSAAILYYKSAAAVQVVTGLPDSVQVGTQLDISALPQAPDTLAISDDGAVVLAGVAENGKDEAARGEVFLVPPDGSAARSIAVVQHASAMAFYTKSQDVLIADDVANSITMVSDAAGQASQQWTFTDAGLPAPDSVQVSADRKTVLAGSSKNGMLAIVDATGVNAPMFVKCQCAPMEVRPFKPAGIFQVTEPGNGLLWIFDSNPVNPRVLFVPVPSDGDAGMGSGQ